MKRRHWSKNGPLSYNGTISVLFMAWQTKANRMNTQANKYQDIPLYAAILTCMYIFTDH